LIKSFTNSRNRVLEVMSVSNIGALNRVTKVLVLS
jgi:hypothetical protein